MKRYITLLLSTFLLAFVTLSAQAAEYPYCWDDARLLTEQEAQALENELADISDRQDFDVVIVTLNSLQGMDEMEVADAIFDQYGYGRGESRDGVLFLLSMEERVCAVSTNGSGLWVINDAAIDDILDAMMYDLGEGDYAAAFETFAQSCDSILTFGRSYGSEDSEDFYGTGEFYDTGETEDFEVFHTSPAFNTGTRLVTAGGFSMAGAFVATSGMKRKLKTVHKATAAANYMKTSSLNLTRAGETYLYNNVRVITRSTPSSGGGGRSSGGHSGGFSARPSGHGGHSRKF